MYVSSTKHRQHTLRAINFTLGYRGNCWPTLALATHSMTHSSHHQLIVALRQLGRYSHDGIRICFSSTLWLCSSMWLACSRQKYIIGLQTLGKLLRNTKGFVLKLSLYYLFASKPTLQFFYKPPFHLTPATLPAALKQYSSSFYFLLSL